MRHLLAMWLWLTSTTLAFGDEGSKPDLVPPVVETPSVPPVIAPPDAVPPGEEAATTETGVWQPRLLVTIRTVDKVSFPTKVRIRERFQPEAAFLRPPPKASPEKPPEIDRFVPAESDAPPFASGEEPKEEKPQESVAYREMEVQTLRFSPGECFCLYCDAVTVNISQEGDTPNYHLECKTRVHISTDGFSVDADSATFKDGKCELVNATLKSGVITATATQLGLTIPVRGVSTSNYGRELPKIPLGVNVISPPPTRGTFFGPDGEVPEPK
jgi:hypothetical protein